MPPGTTNPDAIPVTGPAGWNALTHALAVTMPRDLHRCARLRIAFRALRGR